MARMNLRTRVMLLALCVACGVPVYATTQTPEIVLINGGVYHLWPHQNGSTAPLESLWRNPAAKLGKLAYSSDCHRGYVGIWEIHDDCLSLKGLQGWSDWPADKRLDMKTIFSERFRDGKVGADWFSGQAILAASFGRHINCSQITLPFVKGKVVAPATAQRIGMRNGTHVVPSTHVETPTAPADGDRQSPDGKGDVQMPDTFILDGVVYYLPAQFSVRAFPLESLWKDPETRLLFSRDPNDTDSSAYVRGYRAIWEVHEASLYILALEAWTHGKKVHLRALFPDRFQNGRVKAEWFSGDLALISYEISPKRARTVKSIRPPGAIKVRLNIESANVVSVAHLEEERR